MMSAAVESAIEKYLHRAPTADELQKLLPALNRHLEWMERHPSLTKMSADDRLDAAARVAAGALIQADVQRRKPLWRRATVIVWAIIGFCIVVVGGFWLVWNVHPAGRLYAPACAAVAAYIGWIRPHGVMPWNEATWKDRLGTALSFQFVAVLAAIALVVVFHMRFVSD